MRALNFPPVSPHGWLRLLECLQCKLNFNILVVLKLLTISFGLPWCKAKLMGLGVRLHDFESPFPSAASAMGSLCQLAFPDCSFRTEGECVNECLPGYNIAVYLWKAHRYELYAQGSSDLGVFLLQTRYIVCKGAQYVGREVGKAVVVSSCCFENTTLFWFSYHTESVGTWTFHGLLKTFVAWPCSCVVADGSNRRYLSQWLVTT